MRAGIIDAADSRALRRRVLRPDFGPDDALPGDDLEVTVHIGAVDEHGTVVGTCFLMPEACPWRPDAVGAWRLRSMAVAPELQRGGVGGLVLAAAVDHLAGRDVPLLWCAARQSAAGFYARHDFVSHGAVFIDSEMHLPHVYMARELPRAPASSE
jgi:GNAT superfamily N-acetyltransferase